MMSQNRRRGFCPHPIKSPDPDTSTRSVIVSTKSPTFPNPSPQPLSPPHHPHNPEVAQLRLQNRRLRLQIEQLQNAAAVNRVQTEISRLSEISRSREEEIHRSRLEVELTTEANEELRRKLEQREREGEECSRMLGEKDREITKLARMLRTVQTEGDQGLRLSQRIADVEQENNKLRKKLESKADHFLQEQNVILTRKVEELLGENQAYKEMVEYYHEADSEKVSELKQQQKSLKQELSKSRQRMQSTVPFEAVEKLKQNFQKQVQLCRDRFYELGEQLLQAQGRLERAEKELVQFRTLKFERHKRQGSTALPPSSASKAKRYPSVSPLARGDSGYIEPLAQSPEVSKFEADARSRKHQTHPSKPPHPYPQKYQELMKQLKQKQIQIDRLSTNNRILQEKANILKKQLEERSRMGSPGKDKEIEELRREIIELKKIIEANRGITELNSEITAMKNYIQSMNNTLAEERRIITSLREENDRLRQTLASSHGEAVAQTNDELALLRRENTELKHHIEQLQQYRPSTRVSVSGQDEQINVRMDSLNSLKEENRKLLRKDRRKTDQLEELIRQLGKAKDLLESVSIQEVESRLKSIGQIQRENYKSKEKKIKISYSQKETLRKEYQNLKRKVLSLSDEVIRLTHQNTVIKAQINRLLQDNTTTAQKASSLSQIIQTYINSQPISKLQPSSSSNNSLELQIQRQIRQLERPIDLSNLKVSLKRMESSIQSISIKLRQFI